MNGDRTNDPGPGEIGLAWPHESPAQWHLSRWTGDWYELQRPGLGEDILAEIGRALDVVGENPSIWPRWPGTSEALDVRRFCLPRFPFMLPFMVQAERVVILAVVHEKRSPGFWLDRVKAR